jgi:23S rRNA (adenine2503-C2)-methyltransferase
VSQDTKTIKALFSRKIDDKKLETVLMMHKDGRNTVCVSCMIGCPVNCAFCATGKMGFKANLTAGEIVDQVLYFSKYLSQTDKKVTNVVYMGMGEPLLNYDEVMKSIDILTDEKKMGLSQRRITISTSGYIPQLRKLIASNYKGNLAISLHSANQLIREKIMPVAKVYKINDLMEALAEYEANGGRRITYEYVLIKDLNDTKECAEDLVKLLKGKLALVNLIPYNKVDGADFEKSSKNSIFSFLKILQTNNIEATIRVTMGDDSAAACGQLAQNN